MECPKCEGGEIQIGTGMPSSDGDELWEVDTCPHCDGTGKIKEGDWWKCEVILPPDGGSEMMVLEYWAGKFRTQWKMFRPIARMREVE